MPGEATQIASDIEGLQPWAINDQSQQNIFKWDTATGTFATIEPEGCAVDISVYISVGDYDDIWVVGCEPDYQPFEYTTTTGAWVEKPLPTGVLATRISTSVNGDTLVTDANGGIWLYEE